MSTLNLKKGAQMLKLEEIIERLKDRNLSVVARSVGVTPAYLSAICRGINKNPTYSVVLSLSEYLEKNR